MRRNVLALLLGLAASSGGCGTVCEEAAQICADEGRSRAPASDAEPVECVGEAEARAACIADAETCSPEVVEGCVGSVGGDEDEREGS